MKLAETVTFGTSGLDRAAHLRGTDLADPKPDDQVLVMWRGKVLLDASMGPLRVTPTHPALDGAELIFLGIDEGTHVHMADVSPWAPEQQDAPLSGFSDDTVQVHPLFPDCGFHELRKVMVNLTRRDAELIATGKALFHWHGSHRFCAKCGSASDLTQHGWQRSCSACGAHHFPRTDPVVIMLITHGEQVLLGRSHGWPEGMYSLLAGFVEPGETLEAAVRREVFEETQIQVGDVTYLSSQPWAFPNSLMFGCAGNALTTDIKIDETEIEDAMWVNKSDLMAVLSGERSDIKPARNGSIAHFLILNWLADRLG